jgi:hypothetical protein
MSSTQAFVHFEKEEKTRKMLNNADDKNIL